MSIEATYHSEVRFVRSAHSSKTGTTITLALPDSDELSKVAGFDGKRYMLALVEIGDDEQPVQQPSSPEVGYTPPTPDVPAKPKGGYAAKWLGLRCQEQVFWRFLSESPHLTSPVQSAIDAADVVRDVCGVKSRAEIDNDKMAFTRFETLIRLPYMKWVAIHGLTVPEVEHA